jgi:membrane protein DedA with SNARE-associated domain
MGNILHALLRDSGIWALILAFLAVMLESSAFLGLLIPGETVAFIIGALAGAGALGLRWALGIIAGGAICGDIGGYVLGRWKGEAILTRWAFARRQHERHSQLFESYFRRWGATTVLAGRFVAIGRAFVPFSAGLYKMPAWRFVPMAVLGGAIWGGVVVDLGFWLGSEWTMVEGWFRSIGLGILGLLVLTVAAVMLWRWLSRRQEELQAAWDHYIAQRFGIKIEPLIAFARARLSPTSYLGLHLTVGMLALGGLAWLFGGVIQDIFAQDPLVRVDRAIALFVGAHRAPALNSVMAATAFIANPYSMLAVVTITAIAFIFAGEKTLAISALPIFGSAYGIGVGLRVLFSGFSPSVPPSQLVHGFHGFPSIAMIVATNAYGLAGYAAATYARSWRMRTLGMVAALYLVILIGSGAVYRRQNLSAQIGGFAAGGCWLVICVTGILTYQKLQSPGDEQPM